MIFLIDGTRPNPEIFLTEQEIATKDKPLFLYRRYSQEKPLSVAEEIEAVHRHQAEFLKVIELSIETQNLQNVKIAATKTMQLAKLIVTVCTKVVQDHKNLALVSISA